MKLFQYQSDGIDRLSKSLLSQRGVLLADEPGVGKTAQAIGVANLFCPQSLLVVCPATPRINWQREFQMWSPWAVPEIVTTRSKGPTPAFAITNYDVLHKIPALNRPWDAIIFDEAHYLKSRSATRSKAGKAIADKAKHVIALTGTPIENRPIELWHLMVVLGWLAPGSYMGYAKEHCGYRKRVIYVKGRPREIVDVSGATNIPDLREFLKSKGMVRRTKAEVLPELPPKTYRIMEIPRTKQWRSSLLQTAFGESTKPAKSQLAYFKTLAEIAAKTGDKKHLVESIAEARRLDGVEKIDQIVEYVESCLETEKKIGVYCYHREVHAALMERLSKYGAVGICGGTPQNKRQEAVDSFQADPKCRVFVGQIKAAGTAITLTAASHVVFAELDWVPGLMEQAADRFHRQGQKDHVMVDYVVFEDSTDALVAKRLIEKQKVLGELLNGGSVPSAYEPIDPTEIFA